MSRVQQQGFVYIIQIRDDGPFKIGWALDPQKRLAELQTACPYKLVLRHVRSGDKALEGQLHRQLASQRLSGEWFAPEEETLPASLAEARSPMEVTMYRAMQKFHLETLCGEDRFHWRECQSVAQAFGHASWEEWEVAMGVAMP